MGVVRTLAQHRRAIMAAGSHRRLKRHSNSAKWRGMRLLPTAREGPVVAALMVPSAVLAHLTGRRAAAGPDRVLMAWWSHPASATLAKRCNPSLTTVQAGSRRRLAKPDRDAPQKLATRLSFGRAGLPSGVASTAGLGLHSALLVRLDVHSPPSCGRSSAAPTRGAAGRPAATPLRLSARPRGPRRRAAQSHPRRLDGAGRHQTGGRLRVPGNISLLRLPPCSPELNPQENIWQQKHLATPPAEPGFQPRVRQLRRQRRRLLRRLERPHGHARPHPLHRNPSPR